MRNAIPTHNSQPSKTPQHQVSPSFCLDPQHSNTSQFYPAYLVFPQPIPRRPSPLPVITHKHTYYTHKHTASNTTQTQQRHAKVANTPLESARRNRVYRPIRRPNPTKTALRIVTQFETTWLYAAAS